MRRASGVGREIEIPPFAKRPVREIESQYAARQHLPDALDVRGAMGVRKQPAITQKTVQVGLDKAGPAAQVIQDSADFRGHTQGACIGVIKKWLLAVAVARRRQLAGVLVQQAERPHTVGPVQRIDAFAR